MAENHLQYNRMRPPPKEWLSRKEASRFLESIGCPMSVAQLERMALHQNAGVGPPYNRVGYRTVYYARTDLAAWAAKRIVRVQ